MQSPFFILFSMTSTFYILDFIDDNEVKDVHFKLKRKNFKKTFFFFNYTNPHILMFWHSSECVK